MYYLLAGRLPFSGANTMSVIYQIVNTEPEPPGAHRQGLLPELDAIVLKAMAKDPANRYASWEEFGQALAEVWKKLHQAGERDQSDTERFNLCRKLPVLQGVPRERAVGGAAHLASGASSRPTPRSSRKATTATRSSSSRAATSA